MRLCPACDRHVFEGTDTCPFCRAPCATVRGGSLAILGITLGVAFTACGEPKLGGTTEGNSTASTEGNSTASTEGNSTASTEGSTAGNSTPSTDGNTTVDPDDPEDSFDAYGATYTVSGDSPWSETRTASTETDPHTATGTATDTDADTGSDTGSDTGTTGTDTGTSTTTATDTGSTGAASSTG